MTREGDPSPTPRRVVVIGGGLAGMAAAVALESAAALTPTSTPRDSQPRLAVTLLESRRALGGRAGSFQDPRTGEELDNCQHVLLGCCTNLLDFYRRLGVDHLIRFEPAVPFLDPRGRRHDLYGVPGLPAPLHLGPALLRFGALTRGERLATVAAMLAMARLGPAGRDALADVPFGDWLDRHRQPAPLVEKFYDPVLISALNEHSRRASAASALHVFQEAMLAHRRGYLVGLPNCPLGRLYQSLPCRDVRLGARVEGLRFATPPAGAAAGTPAEMPAGRVTGVELVGGEVIAADAVVLAVGHHAARRWVGGRGAGGNGPADARLQATAGLEDVPILGAHLWFDRPVFPLPFAALLTTPLQWIFRKDAEGRAVHGVISAAREWVGRPREQCLDLFQAQLRAILPAAREAKLLRGVVVVEKRATFSPLPGSDRHRPPQAPPPGGIENLFLAGDYTATAWPATMEGAVRGGYLAAEAVVRRLSGAGGRFLVPDLAVEWPMRLFRWPAAKRMTEEGTATRRHEGTKTVTKKRKTN